MFINPGDTAKPIYHWIRNYVVYRHYSEIRHGDRLRNYVSNDIFVFAVSSGLTKILPKNISYIP